MSLLVGIRGGMLIRKGLLLDIMTWRVGAYLGRALIRAWALFLEIQGEKSLSCTNRVVVKP